MGKLYPFNAIMYDDRVGIETPIADYGRVIFPLGVSDNSTASRTVITSDYNFFTDHFLDDATFLGCPYVTRSDYTNPMNVDPASWLPNSPLIGTTDPQYAASDQTNYQLRFTSPDGYWFDVPAEANGSGSTKIGKDNTTIASGLFSFWFNLRSRSANQLTLMGLTVSDMGDDGIIPSTASFYSYSLRVNVTSNKVEGSRSAPTISASDKEKLITWLNSIAGYTPGGHDPYTPGEEGDIDGPSGPGGGGGDHDTTSDPIDIPTLPTTSAVDTGFITLFNPSLSEIRALADYMWNGLFDINNLRKLFADPMDVILGLSIVPGPVPSGAQEAVSIGNISTGVMMTKAADQFFTVDCGTLKPTEFWGAYLDYSPYTKVDIYLPFIGMRSLSIDDVMEKNVNVVYHVDILSGACVAFIKSGDQVLYTHIGQCASSIPINGNDWTNTINGILSMAAAIAGTVATGGAAAPMLMGQAANITNILKPSVARSGGMGGMGGMLGIQKPYLILTRPRQCVPGNQNIYKGYPAFMTRALGDLSGMTSVEDIHLAVSGATQEELEEIERLLKEGVML